MITVVAGPPCAGKSTYIRQRAVHGDVVIDMDRLASALGAVNVERQDHPASVRYVAKAARAAAIRAAIQAAASTGLRVWIIDTWATQQQWARFDAKVVTIDPGINVCLARAAEQRPERIRSIIVDWYAKAAAIFE